MAAHLMRSPVSSCIMRTTIDIEAPILADLKALAEHEGKTLGRTASELLARALVDARRRAPAPPPFRWIAQPMGVAVDLADRDALLDAMDAR